jgi:hypothetical protein
LNTSPANAPGVPPATIKAEVKMSRNRFEIIGARIPPP